MLIAQLFPIVLIPTIVASLSIPRSVQIFGTPPSSLCKLTGTLNKSKSSEEVNRIFKRYESLAQTTSTSSNDNNDLKKRDDSLSSSFGNLAAQAAILQAGLIAYREAQVVQAATNALLGGSSKNNDNNNNNNNGGNNNNNVNGIPVTVQMKPDAFGLLPLTDSIINDMDTAYFGTISVGTPPQKVTVTFDTGSSDLFLATTCPTTGCPAGIFTTSSSSSFIDTKVPLTLQFVQGVVSGSIAHDVVTIAGLTIPSQTFLAANHEDSSFDGFPTTGLLGLGFASQSKTNKPTVIDNIISNYHLTHNLFGLYLARKSPQGSTLSIGSPDENHLSGTITYLPVVGSGYWQIQATSIITSGGTIYVGNVAVIDSGTTQIIMPKALARQLYSSIPGTHYDSKDSQTGAEYYSYPCKNPPIVSFTFEGLGNQSPPFNINGLDFSIGGVDGDTNLCYGTIIGGDTPGNVIILGSQFLKSWYSIYTYEGPAGRPAVGFAASK